MKNKESESEDNVIYGNFDGQSMITESGEAYPVPENYASKSRLLEGDGLKLSIQENGEFLFKLVNPTHRKRIISEIKENKEGILILVCEGKEFKISASVKNFFKLKDGNKVMAIIPKFEEAEWAAIEGVIQ